MQERKNVWVAEFMPPLAGQREALEEVATVTVGHGKKYIEEELIANIAEVDGVLVTAKAPITAEVIRAAKRLKVIGKYGVGFESVDLEAATARRIPVTYTPGVNQDTVAEYTIALLFATVRRVPFSMGVLRSGGNWRNENFIGLEVLGSTIGIIGLGRIGSRVAQKMRSFDVRIISYDPYVSAERAAELGAERVELPDLLARSDVITLNLPLTHETFHLIGEKELRQMKPASYLINTGRGQLVDESALIRALQEGWIAGAGLDVFEQEPLDVKSPLVSMENVVLTPHIGGSSTTARTRLVRTAVENVVRVLRGERPDLQNVANPQVYGKG